MTRTIIAGVCGALIATALCFAPAELHAAGKTKSTSDEGAYYSGSKLRELVDHYLTVNSPTYDNLQDKYKLVYALHASELHGLALGLLYSSADKDPQTCLSWQGRNQYVAKFALTLRDVLAYQHQDDQPGPFILLAAAGVACDQSQWTKKK